MNQPYFIVVLAHSLHGRIRRFQVDQKVVFLIVGLAVLGCFTLFGMVSSYVRMAWKVSNYNDLREEAQSLRARYKKLQEESNQTTEQMNRLQLFASEVSMAYGIQRPAPPSMDSADLRDGSLVPSLTQTLEQYDMLKMAKLSSYSRGINRRWMVHMQPSIWPVSGRLLSHFGSREDPFSGLQAFHTGVDISAPVGTPVRVAADGIVTEADWEGGYGKLIAVDHGGGLQTRYGHLSRIDVIPGQEVRMGQIIGATGATGRVTAPHLHYEVREGGGPKNPYTFLARSAMVPSTGPKNLGF